MTKLRLKEVMWFAQSHLNLIPKPSNYFPISCCKRGKMSFSELLSSRTMCFCFLSWFKLSRNVLIITNQGSKKLQVSKASPAIEKHFKQAEGQILRKPLSYWHCQNFQGCELKRKTAQVYWQAANGSVCPHSTRFSELCALDWWKPCRIPSKYHYFETWEDHRKILKALSQAKFRDITENISPQMWGFSI